MPELAPKAPSKATREPTLEPPVGKAARAIALWRLAFFILVTVVVLGAVLWGAADGGSPVVEAMSVGAVFLGSFVASLAGFAFAAGAGSHRTRIDQRMLRRAVLVSLLVSGSAFILS